MPLVGPINVKPHHRGGSVAEDQRLVDRCLNNEPGAWDLLYKQCHEPLLAAIKSFAGAKGNDPEFVDEIAARVWYVVVCGDGHVLRRFDPERDCRLITFLGGIARNQLRVHSRTELRQRIRELNAGTRPARVGLPNTGISDLEMDELIETLTMREREFLVWSTSTSSADRAGDHFAATAAQWGYRLRRKIRRYFETK